MMENLKNEKDDVYSGWKQSGAVYNAEMKRRINRETRLHLYS